MQWRDKRRGHQGRHRLPPQPRPVLICPLAAIADVTGTHVCVGRAAETLSAFPLLGSSKGLGYLATASESGFVPGTINTHNSLDYIEYSGVVLGQLSD